MGLHLQPEHAGLWCSEDLHIITIKSLVPAFFVKLELGCGEKGKEARFLFLSYSSQANMCLEPVNLSTGTWHSLLNEACNCAERNLFFLGRNVMSPVRTEVIWSLTTLSDCVLL